MATVIEKAKMTHVVRSYSESSQAAILLVFLAILGFIVTRGRKWNKNAAADPDDPPAVPRPTYQADRPSSAFHVSPTSTPSRQHFNPLQESKSSHDPHFDSGNGEDNIIFDQDGRRIMQQARPRRGSGVDYSKDKVDAMRAGLQHDVDANAEERMRLKRNGAESDEELQQTQETPIDRPYRHTSADHDRVRGELMFSDREPLRPLGEQNIQDLRSLHIRNLRVDDVKYSLLDPWVAEQDQSHLAKVLSAHLTKPENQVLSKAMEHFEKLGTADYFYLDKAMNPDQATAVCQQLREYESEAQEDTWNDVFGSIPWALIDVIDAAQQQFDGATLETAVKAMETTTPYNWSYLSQHAPKQWTTAHFLMGFFVQTYRGWYPDPVTSMEKEVKNNRGEIVRFDPRWRVNDPALETLKHHELAFLHWLQYMGAVWFGMRMFQPTGAELYAQDYAVSVTLDPLSRNGATYLMNFVVFTTETEDAQTGTSPQQLSSRLGSPAELIRRCVRVALDRLDGDRLVSLSDKIQDARHVKVKPHSVQQIARRRLEIRPGFPVNQVGANSKQRSNYDPSRAPIAREPRFVRLSDQASAVLESGDLAALPDRHLERVGALLRALQPSQILLHDRRQFDWREGSDKPEANLLSAKQIEDLLISGAVAAQGQLAADNTYPALDLEPCPIVGIDFARIILLNIGLSLKHFSTLEYIILPYAPYDPKCNDQPQTARLICDSKWGLHNKLLGAFSMSGGKPFKLRVTGSPSAEKLQQPRSTASRLKKDLTEAVCDMFPDWLRQFGSEATLDGFLKGEVAKVAQIANNSVIIVETDPNSKQIEYTGRRFDWGTSFSGVELRAKEKHGKLVNSAGQWIKSAS